jgi:hypothetical protein
MIHDASLYCRREKEGGSADKGPEKHIEEKVDACTAAIARVKGAGAAGDDFCSAKVACSYEAGDAQLYAII